MTISIESVPIPYVEPPAPLKQTHPRAQAGYTEWLFRNGPPSRAFFDELKKEIPEHEILWLMSNSCTDSTSFFVAKSTIPGAGYGLFTFRAIKAKKTPIIYYSGEILNEEQVRARYKLHPNQSINDAKCEYLATLAGIYIDATNDYHSGNARYINHQAGDKANCRLSQYGGIIPIKNIPAHSELTYSYSGRWQKLFSSSESPSNEAPEAADTSDD